MYFEGYVFLKVMIKLESTLHSLSVVSNFVVTILRSILDFHCALILSQKYNSSVSLLQP